MARLGYARATGERAVAAGAAVPSRRRKPAGGICHRFLWPESCPVSQSTNQELCGEARSETAPSRVRCPGSFDPGADAVTPEGCDSYCADQNAIAIPGGPTPPKGPVLNGGARNGIAAAGSERTWQSPSNLLIGAFPQNGIAPLQSETLSER